MRRLWTTWAGRLLIGVALVMLAAPAALATICDEKIAGPEGAAYDRILPLSGFTEAYVDFQHARGAAARETLQTELRSFVQFNSELVHERHLEYAWAQAFDLGFIALYEDALTWGRALCEPGGEKAYAEHLAYLARPDETSQRFARSLKVLAARLGHPQSLYDFALRDIEDDEGRVRRLGVARLRRAADGGHVPAQLEIAALYEQGRVAPPDRAKAYYWLIRAQRNGAEVPSAYRRSPRRCCRRNARRPRLGFLPEGCRSPGSRLARFRRRKVVTSEETGTFLLGH